MSNEKPKRNAAAPLASGPDADDNSIANVMSQFREDIEHLIDHDEAENLKDLAIIAMGLEEIAKRLRRFINRRAKKFPEVDNPLHVLQQLKRNRSIR